MATNLRTVTPQAVVTRSSSLGPAHTYGLRLAASWFFSTTSSSFLVAVLLLDFASLLLRAESFLAMGVGRGVAGAGADEDDIGAGGAGQR